MIIGSDNGGGSEVRTDIGITKDYADVCPRSGNMPKPGASNVVMGDASYIVQNILVAPPALSSSFGMAEV